MILNTFILHMVGVFILYLLRQPAIRKFNIKFSMKYDVIDVVPSNTFL